MSTYIQNEPGFTEFIDKTVNTQLPGYLNDIKLFDLHMAYQLVGNTTLRNTASRMVDPLLRRQLSKSHFMVNLAIMKGNGFNIEKFTIRASQKLYWVILIQILSYT